MWVEMVVEVGVEIRVGLVEDVEDVELVVEIWEEPSPSPSSPLSSSPSLSAVLTAAREEIV